MRVHISKEPAATILKTGDGGSRFLWSVASYPPSYRGSHPRQQGLSVFVRVVILYCRYCTSATEGYNTAYGIQI